MKVADFCCDAAALGTVAEALTKILVEGPVVPHGICGNLSVLCDEGLWPVPLVGNLAKDWAHYSGDKGYPVPCASGLTPPVTLYYSSVGSNSLWADTPYGNLRRSLVAHLLLSVQNLHLEAAVLSLITHTVGVEAFLVALEKLYDEVQDPRVGICGNLSDILKCGEAYDIVPALAMDWPSHRGSAAFPVPHTDYLWEGQGLEYRRALMGHMSSKVMSAQSKFQGVQLLPLPDAKTVIDNYLGA